MSIFIKGIEIPKNCGYCNADLACAAKCIRTQRLVLPSEYDTSKRHPACPLGELPPHGDLIDVSKISLQEYEQAAHDALHNGKGSILYDSGVLAGARAITLLVRRAPVVVPAERSDEDA